MTKIIRIKAIKKHS